MLDLDGAWLPAQTQYALLHPQVGIALLDVVPGTTTTHAAERLRQRLNAAGFHIEFERNPPIRYFRVALPAVHDISRLLDQEFGRRSPAPLPRGAWVAAAQRLLATDLPSLPAEPASGRGADDQAMQRQVRARQPPTAKRSPARPLGGARWLGVFWGLMALTVGGGAVLLHTLGTPQRSPDASGIMDTEPVSGFAAMPAPSPTGVTSVLAETMVRRADALLQRGDVSGARLLYERAAAAGAGAAALGMGKTYDATFLAGIGITGMGADSEVAMRWYRRAAVLGDAAARTRLQASTPPISNTSSALEDRR